MLTLSSRSGLGELYPLAKVLAGSRLTCDLSRISYIFWAFAFFELYKDIPHGERRLRHKLEYAFNISQSSSLCAPAAQADLTFNRQSFSSRALSSSSPVHTPPFSLSSIPVSLKRAFAERWEA